MMGTKATEKRVKRAIQALDKAATALDDLLEDSTDSDLRHAGDSRLRLRTDIIEYADYLERAKWWRCSHG